MPRGRLLEYGAIGDESSLCSFDLPGLIYLIRRRLGGSPGRPGAQPRHVSKGGLVGRTVEDLRWLAAAP